MILTHKTGVLLHGTLAKDPVLKDVGQKQVLKFDVKAHSVKTGTGSWEGLYVQVNVWHGLDKWDGLLLKGEWKAAPAELALYIGLTFALLFAGVYISSTLEEPEYLAAYSYTENGVPVEEPEQKNPHYISGVNAHVT